jgi:hypothetical protein
MKTVFVSCVKTLHIWFHLKTLFVICNEVLLMDYIYTGCPRRNVPHFGRVFLVLKYSDITQNTYNQS